MPEISTTPEAAPVENTEEVAAAPVEVAPESTEAVPEVAPATEETEKPE